MTKLEGGCKQHGLLGCKVCNPPKQTVPVVASPPRPTVEIVEDAPLTPAEVEQLGRLEATVEKGATVFREVADALMGIRDGRLYRQDFPSFEAYCKARWAMSGSRARQMIAAAETIAAVESVTTVTLPNERQARELAPIRDNPEAIAAVIEATGGKVTTAKALHEAVSEHVEREPSKWVRVLRSDVEALLGGTADAETMARVKDALA